MARYFKVLFLILFTISVSFCASWYASGTGGAVAAGGTAKSAEAGLEILKDGGTAADAAAATLLALTLEDRNSFCFGGEVPLIHYEASSGNIKVLSGQGRAPLNQQSINWLLQNGIPNPNASNNIKSAAVPAVVDLCVTVMQQWGKLSFEEVAQPAMRILRSGSVSWYDELEATMNKLISAEKNATGTRVQKLQAVSDRFYRGDIAEALDQWYRQKGGFLRKEDLAAHKTNIEDPITSTYKGYTIHKCDTWTQGAFFLQTLKMLEPYNLKSMGHMSTNYIHTVSEAMKLCFADRDEYLADPAFETVPLKELMDSSYIAIRRKLIKSNRASDTIISGDPINKLARNPNPHPRLKWPKGTTTCCVVDQWGNVVACTPSGWGSKAGVGNTGVVHGTRLISINNWQNHPNIIKPGKRPCITLTPTIVTKDGKPLLAISVAGGDEQEQSTLNLFMNFIEFDMVPKDAVSVPRFTTSHYTSFFAQVPPQLARLWISSKVPSSVRNALSNRGHDVRTMSVKSNPVMIHIDQEKHMYHAAGCPTSRRNCKAYDLPVPISQYQKQIQAKKLEIVHHSGYIEFNYSISHNSDAALSIYRADGRFVTDIACESSPGNHSTTWKGTTAQGNKLSTGCYIAQWRNGNAISFSRFMFTQ